jgi:hypothetical protein
VKNYKAHIAVSKALGNGLYEFIWEGMYNQVRHAEMDLIVEAEDELDVYEKINTASEHTLSIVEINECSTEYVEEVRCERENLANTKFMEELVQPHLAIDILKRLDRVVPKISNN